MSWCGMLKCSPGPWTWRGDGLHDGNGDRLLYTPSRLSDADRSAIALAPKALALLDDIYDELHPTFDRGLRSRIRSLLKRLDGQSEE